VGGIEDLHSLDPPNEDSVIDPGVHIPKLELPLNMKFAILSLAGQDFLTLCLTQGFGSGSGSVSGSVMDPYSIGPLDPDP
jgi:hypothetical protein